MASSATPYALLPTAPATEPEPEPASASEKGVVGAPPVTTASLSRRQRHLLVGLSTLLSLSVVVAALYGVYVGKGGVSCGRRLERHLLARPFGSGEELVEQEKVLYEIELAREGPTTFGGEPAGPGFPDGPRDLIDEPTATPTPLTGYVPATAPTLPTPTPAAERASNDEVDHRRRHKRGVVFEEEVSHVVTTLPDPPRPTAEEYSYSILRNGETATFVRTTRPIVNPGGFTLGTLDGVFVQLKPTKPPTLRHQELRRREVVDLQA